MIVPRAGVLPTPADPAACVRPRAPPRRGYGLRPAAPPGRPRRPSESDGQRRAAGRDGDWTGGLRDPAARARARGLSQSLCLSQSLSRSLSLHLSLVLPLSLFLSPSLPLSPFPPLSRSLSPRSLLSGPRAGTGGHAGGPFIGPADKGDTGYGSLSPLSLSSLSLLSLSPLSLLLSALRIRAIRGMDSTWGMDRTLSLSPLSISSLSPFISPAD